MVKNPRANAGDAGDVSLIPGSGTFPWSTKWQPTLVLLSGKFHGQRSLVGYHPGGRKESNTTELTCRQCQHPSEAYCTGPELWFLSFIYLLAHPFINVHLASSAY